MCEFIQAHVLCSRAGWYPDYIVMYNTEVLFCSNNCTIKILVKWYYHVIDNITVFTEELPLTSLHICLSNKS